MEYDLQLGLVEFAVPLVQVAGSVVFFLGILIVFNQVNIVIFIIIDPYSLRTTLLFWILN